MPQKKRPSDKKPASPKPPSEKKPAAKSPAAKAPAEKGAAKKRERKPAATRTPRVAPPVPQISSPAIRPTTDRKSRTSSPEQLHIVMVTSEAHPFAKTGGLAEV